MFAVLAVVLTPIGASATPNDVFADYFVDTYLNGRYTVEDLRTALTAAEKQVGKGVRYRAFADSVSEAITGRLAGTIDTAEDQLGVQSPHSTEATPSPHPTTTVTDNDGLPAPPVPNPSDELPTAVPIMGVVALGLVAIGLLSAMIRRRR